MRMRFRTWLVVRLETNCQSDDTSGMVQNKVGNLKDKVDRGLLHEYLWKHRTRTNFMSGSQDELADGLGISKTAMSLILKEMAEYGMLVKVRRGTWLIVDPHLYALGEKPVEDGRLFDG